MSLWTDGDVEAVLRCPVGIVRVLYLFWNRSGVEFWGKARWPANLARTPSDKQWPTDPGPCLPCVPERSIKAYPDGHPCQSLLELRLVENEPPCLPGKGFLEKRRRLGVPGCPGLSWGLKSAGDLFASGRPPGPFRPTALWWFRVGPFFKTRETDKRDREEIPRVLRFLATRHDVHCSEKSNGKQGKYYSQWKQVLSSVQTLLNNV